MKNTLILFLLLYRSLTYAQLNDDFTDGNFTASPVWTGSNSGADFTIVNNRLRSNSTIAGSNFYISTVNTLALNTKWEFWVNLQFSTSGANYTDIYLISDKSDLQNNMINGYFVRIGNTDDEISLYKRSGLTGSSTKIIDGVNSSVGASNNTVKVRVSRSNTGLFTLERDVTGSNSSFYTEGTTRDMSFTSSAFLGIYIQQSTSSFFQKHFFDDFLIETIVSDTIPPVINSVAAIDSNTIELTFSEAMDSLSVKNIANFLLNNFNGQAVKIYTTTDPGKFRIRFSQTLNTGNYLLTVINVKDKNGNTIANSTVAAFNYTKPYTVKFRDIIINEIFADPAPQIDLPSVEFVEIINTSNETISLNNWHFSDPSSTAQLGNTSISPNSFLILCAKADTSEFKKFGKVLGISPWPSLNNSGDAIKLKSSTNLLIDSLSYSDLWYRDIIKKQGGWSLERIDPLSQCEGAFNWTASKDPSGGTPGKQNSVHSSNYDHKILKADSLIRTSDTTLLIYFNKHLNGITLLDENFTLLPQSGKIKKISADTYFKEVNLTFSDKFIPGKTYQLRISNLKDCSGNTISTIPEYFNFSLPQVPPPPIEKPDTAIIFITEIFVDPSPEVGLPLVEFVEIYNPGKDTVDLEGWSLSDPQTKSTLKKLLLPPQHYLILCPVADTLQYKNFGKTLGISPWPSLNNSSDQIVLKSFKNRIVDSVAFADSWYHDNLKKQGGWTLERIDLFSKCEGFFNWSASKDKSGGSPGRENSMHFPGYDLLTLNADSLRQTSDTSLILYFNKHLNSAGILKDNFSLSPASGTIKKISADAEYKLVSLIFSQRFSPGTDYQLTVSNIKDCSGNTIGRNQNLKFKIPKLLPPLPEKTDTARIFITEIFADPSPEVGLPLVEFVEIYNPGKDTVDLENWSINDPQSKGMFKKSILLPQQYLILCPVADTLQYKNFGKTLGISPWPSLNNSSDQIVLKSFKKRMVDSVSYSDTWYRESLKKSGGWSLEKIDMSNNSCPGFYNWRAAISTSGGTPGQINSIDKPGYVSKPLKIDSVSRTSDSTLVLIFNQIPDTTSLNASNFRINNEIGKAQRASFSSGYDKILLEFKNKFQEGAYYTVSVDSLYTCTRLLFVKADNQVSFSIPLVQEIEYPIVINEILADPSPVAGLPEAEFVELYNPTENAVDIKGLMFGNPIKSFQFNSGEIAPRSYLILCAAKDSSSFTIYGNVIGLPSWPGLNNEAGVLILKNNKGREFHNVRYDVSWYKDADKKKGGYSLELIDPKSICLSFQNWTGSKDISGGTPGRQNSAYLVNDLPSPLKLTEVLLTDSVSLSLLFSRNIDSISASKIGNFTLNNGIGNPVASLPLGPYFNKVVLKFREPLTRGHTYRIAVNNISDCKGSLIAAEFNYSEFILPHKIGKNDILLTEILFNPRPEGVDFVEIYNNTDYALDMKELSLARIIKDTIDALQPLSTKQLLLASRHYLALTSNPENIKKEYFTQNPDAFLKMQSFPSFNNDAGTVVIISDGQRIDQLTYTEKMHFPLIKNVEGVSLERSMLSRPASDKGNLRSATAASGFATPAYQNSQYTDDLTSIDEFTLKSKTFSPDNDGFEDILQIHYRFSNPGKIANVSIFNDQGILIKKLLKNFTLNTEGSFVWDGFNDYNQLASSGIYLIYAEIFDTDGGIKKYRKPCVLAVKFN